MAQGQVAMAFMSFTKQGLSAYEMQRQIGHRWYESIGHDAQDTQETDFTRNGSFILVRKRTSSFPYFCVTQAD